MPYFYHRHFHFAPMEERTVADAMAKAERLHLAHELRYLVWSLEGRTHVTPPERTPIGATKHFDTNDL